jgi:hypothetical protein
MADVQVSVRLGGKAGVYPCIVLVVADVFLDNTFDKVEGLRNFLVLFAVIHAACGVNRWAKIQKDVDTRYQIPDTRYQIPDTGKWLTADLNIIF